jgi:hypothetical protein
MSVHIVFASGSQVDIVLKQACPAPDPAPGPTSVSIWNMMQQKRNFRKYRKNDRRQFAIGCVETTLFNGLHFLPKAGQDPAAMLPIARVPHELQSLPLYVLPLHERLARARPVADTRRERSRRYRHLAIIR